MKKILVFILVVFLVCSCGCGHKEGEAHTPNDTILCVVDKTSKDLVYNVVIHIVEYEYYVEIRNIETGNKRKFESELFFNMFNDGDTIYQIVQHCPYYRVKLVNR